MRPNTKTRASVLILAGVLIGLTAAVFAPSGRAATSMGPNRTGTIVKANPASGGGGGAVSSVTGSNNLTCSPTTGAVVCSGAAFATSASLATVATSGSAADLATGTLAAARMPALTGDCTTSAGAVATSCANATTSTHGMMAAADKVTVNDAASTWAYTQYLNVHAHVAAITWANCRYMNLGNVQGIASNTDYAGLGTMTGGGFEFSGGTAYFATSNFIQHSQSKAWAIVVNAIFATPVTSRVTEVQLFNAGISHAVAFGTNYAGDTTHLVIRNINPSVSYQAATVVADAAQHVYEFSSNATTATLYQDNVSTGASIATSSQFGDEAWRLRLSNSTTGDLQISDILYCWGT